MEYVYTGLVSLAVTMLAFILQSTLRENRRLKRDAETKHMDEYKAIKEGVLCLLRVKLIEYHSKYMERGTISSHAYDNWELMHKAYKGLGGNGMVDHMKEEIEELHIEH